ncbi:MAG TPA: cupin domain-containing protein [Noviherbaspirillum sp.]|nr:cupin domain-containing protein [Noviherbaspirillum sp.]
MSLPHAASGDIIDVRPLGPKLADAVSTALFKTDQLEAMRLVLTTGKEIPEHHVAGDFTLHCIEGKVELRVNADVRTLQAGEMVFVAAEAPYSIRALADASLLMTLARCREGG